MFIKGCVISLLILFQNWSVRVLVVFLAIVFLQVIPISFYFNRTHQNPKFCFLGCLHYIKLFNLQKNRQERVLH